MGKQNFNKYTSAAASYNRANNYNTNNNSLRGRLSLDRSMGATDRGYDARFKLLKRSPGSAAAAAAGGYHKSRGGGAFFVKRDARELLLESSHNQTHYSQHHHRHHHHQQQQHEDHVFRQRDRALTDPIVIVTGLSNVRRDFVNNRVRVVNRPPSPGKSVISNGVNTIVTLRNLNMDKMRYTAASDGGPSSSKNGNHDIDVEENVAIGGDGGDDLDEDVRDKIVANQHVARRDGKIDNHDKEFKAIKVMIDNDLMMASASAAQSAATKQSSTLPNRRPNSPSPSHFRREQEVNIGHNGSRYSQQQQRRSPSPTTRRTPHVHHAATASSSTSISSKPRHHHRSDDREMMDYEETHHYHNSTNSSTNGDHNKNGNGNSSNSSSSGGYKLVVSNLHSRVTEDDILELFSDIGPIKRARFLDKGVAEVVYVKLEHAQDAIYKYDRNELDGRQMRIELVGNSSSSTSTSSSSGNQKASHSTTSSSSSSSKKPIESSSKSSHRSSNTNTSSSSNRTSEVSSTVSAAIPSNSLSNRFKQFQRNEPSTIQLPKSSDSSSRVNVNSSIIQSVLFKKAAGGAREDAPVTFTVKL